jgi:hypothetical protein
MPESTLTVCWVELASAVGWFLYGRREIQDLSALQRSVVEDVIDLGYRMFAYPPAAPDHGVEAGYSWSFLKLTTTITTSVGYRDQDLPHGFGRLIGDGLTYAADAQVPPVLADVGEGRIRKLRLQSDEDGRPRVAAIRWKSTDGESPQLAEIMWFPNPDSAYTLTYRFEAQIDALSQTANFAFGRLAHADAMRACCIAAADASVNDVRDGPTYVRAMRALASSIRRDKASGAQFYGDVGPKDQYSSDAALRDQNYTMTINDEQIYPSS